MSRKLTRACHVRTNLEDLVQAPGFRDLPDPANVSKKDKDNDNACSTYVVQGPTSQRLCGSGQEYLHTLLSRRNYVTWPVLGTKEMHMPQGS